ncbi:MAG: S9 family peptidase, partial [Pyrinomonadaceae bacterium]
MNSLFTRACAVALALAASAFVAEAQSARFNVGEMLKVQRVADPQLSPDGRWVAYQVTVPDVPANRNRTQIFVVAVAGGEPKQLTSGAASSTAPRWSPDGRRITYTSGGQVWTMNPDGSERKQVTNISTGASDPVWSPDGRLLAFASDVYPDCAGDACNRARNEEAEKNPVKPHVTTRLFVRHWVDWKGPKRTHVFVVPVEGGAARDLTPGDWDAPPFSLGGPTDYAFSRDSKELAYARNTDPLEATSTNSDIFVVSVTGGEPRRLTGDNKGADSTPLYSPDGRFLAYRSQATPAFESDRWRLMLYDLKAHTTRELTAKFDANVEGFIFAPDSRSIYFASGERGEQPIFNISLDDGSVRKLVNGFNDDVKISNDSHFLVFTRSDAAHATEIYTARMDGVVPAGGSNNQAAALTHTNDSFMQQFSLRPAEELTWTGAGGTKVAGWLVKPPDFDPKRKYPLVVLIHGGPQGSWNNGWSYRWNPQIYAAAGYVAFLPNPRGSTGYGQQFTNEISGDWGGKAYTDIMNGVASVISNNSFIDKDRVGAAGASY